MNPTPTVGELGWLAGVTLLLVAALGLRIRALGAISPSGQVDPVRTRLRRLSRLLIGLGFLGGLGLIVYRDLVRSYTCPILNNYDSAVLFTVMTGGLLFYMLLVTRRHISGPGRTAVDLILLPLMIAAAVYGLAINVQIVQFREYEGGGLWRPIHLASLVLGSMGLLYAAVTGVMYLLVDRALRHKQRGRLVEALPSLERLESGLHHGVLWGFWLLTLGMLSGVFLVVIEQRVSFRELLASPKVWVATAAWAIFAVVLNVRMIPQFRGRRAAWFCIAGFALIIVAYVIVQLVPMG